MDTGRGGEDIPGRPRCKLVWKEKQRWHCMTDVNAQLMKAHETKLDEDRGKSDSPM